MEYINGNYNDLFESEDEIKQNLEKKIIFNGSYKRYGLVNNKWYQKYKNHLLNGKINNNFCLDFSELDTKIEKKLFCYLGNDYSFGFLSNFVVVTEKFINSLSKSFYCRNELKHTIRQVLIGGFCIIRRDGGNEYINYITFYEENKDNNIDFLLIINNKEQNKKHLNLILNNNLWFYLELINFYYTDVEKEIFDDKGKKIGYFIRNCELDRSKFLYNKKNEYINKHNNEFNQFMQNNNANIERIPKANSIFICLSLFIGLKNEFIKFSQVQDKNIMK